MILQNTIKKASQFLKNNNISSHQLDAEIILCNIMKIKKEFLLTNGHLDISANILKKFNLAVNRRAKSEPVAYITGIKEFWSEDFVVNRNTLVPRPETELLIYKVVDFYKNNPNLMNNLRGVALEEKIMKYVVNSCNKKDKVCTIDELFKSDFLQNEKKLISNKQKESEK